MNKKPDDIKTIDLEELEDLAVRPLSYLEEVALMNQIDEIDDFTWRDVSGLIEVEEERARGPAPRPVPQQIEKQKIEKLVPISVYAISQIVQEDGDYLQTMSWVASTKKEGEFLYMDKIKALKNHCGLSDYKALALNHLILMGLTFSVEDFEEANIPRSFIKEFIKEGLLERESLLSYYKKNKYFPITTELIKIFGIKFSIFLMLKLGFDLEEAGQLVLLDLVDRREALFFFMEKGAFPISMDQLKQIGVKYTNLDVCEAEMTPKQVSILLREGLIVSGDVIKFTKDSSTVQIPCSDLREWGYTFTPPELRDAGITRREDVVKLIRAGLVRKK